MTRAACTTSGGRRALRGNAPRPLLRGLVALAAVRVAAVARSASLQIRSQTVALA